MGTMTGGKVVVVSGQTVGSMTVSAYKSKLDAVLQMIDFGDLGGGTGYGCAEHKASLYVIEKQIAETRKTIRKMEADDSKADQG